MMKVHLTYVRKLLKIFSMLVVLCLSVACKGPGLPDDVQVDSFQELAKIYPDYSDLTLPVNIAPLHFQVREEGEAFRVFLEGSSGELLKMKNRSKKYFVSSEKWKKFMDDNQGKTFKIRIYKKEHGQWVGFTPIVNQVSSDAIDPFLAYRLIPPGYETWSYMGLFQRDLTGFGEDPIIENKHLRDNCVNCHSFSNGNPENMMFHIRGSAGGTLIRKGEKISKVDLKREETLSAGVYPSWHPSGDYIAFSTNKIEQYFHAHPEGSIEVLDRHSDLILYHTNTGEVSFVPGTRGDNYMETFPGWSPDGKHLYFSRSDAQSDTPFDSVRYDIYRTTFDPDKGHFGEIEPVLNVTEKNRSASFPRISPDGKHLLCTVHNYGTFPIWHKDADLCLVNLATGESRYPAEINSEDTESFHSWSSNSRWIVFSSRRDDGLYTRLYLAHVDEEGNFQKPFLLPQKSPEHHNNFYFSYNVPELVTEKIDVKSRRWVKAALR